jgi:hypothetical protein
MSSSTASAVSSSSEDSAARTSASAIASGASASPSSSAKSGASSSNRSNTGLAAGLGAGLGVAVLLIVALAFFVIRSRRQQGQGGDEVIVSPYKSEMLLDGHDQTPFFQRQSANKSELPAPSEQTRSDIAGNPPMETEYRSGARSGGWQQARAELGS